MSAQPKIDQREATLRGIADYAARARLDLRQRPAAQIADDVLRHIEQAALEALDELPARLAPRALTIAPAAGGATAGRRGAPATLLTLERCIDLLLDPRGPVGRMRIDQLLALVPQIGQAGAERIVDEHRWAGGRAVSTIPLSDRARLAAQLRTECRENA